ncbi:MAG: aminotransferase class IV [Anaerolineales bacterium]|nr:aminotransferase class IV [Anaerolineales bacterium]
MTIKAFRLTIHENIPLNLSASTLDELTSQLSDGFYTTFSTLSGGTRVLGLQAHLHRLYVPAAEMGLRPSVDEKTLRQRMGELTRENLPQETRIRLILAKDTGDVYVGYQPFIPVPEAVYRDGVHAVTADMARHDPRIKGTDFITQSAEQRKLVKGDIYEILLVCKGKILEGMTSNFYGVKYSKPQDNLVTAQKGILLGVTRRVVLRLARGQGMSIMYRSPRVDENLDEAFLTSSSRGVVPIVSIDGKPVGQGKVGEWAKTLRKLYQAYVEERSERIV